MGEGVWSCKIALANKLDSLSVVIDLAMCADMNSATFVAIDLLAITRTVMTFSKGRCGENLIWRKPSPRDQHSFVTTDNTIENMP